MKNILMQLLVLISTIIMAIHPSHTQPPESPYEPPTSPYTEDNDIVEQVVDDEIIVATRGSERTIGEFKTYMDYRTITNETSTQWYMQQAAWTAPNGIRCYGDRYMVAMGTYYSSQCGDKFDITLDTGQIIYVIIGDVKADCDTDVTNMYVEKNGNVVEFIVDVDVLDETTLQMGDLSYSGFEGGIVDIVKVEEE